MITIFTDGASRGNPGPGGWGAIIVQSEIRQLADKVQSVEAKITELGGREERTTNNRMEITAAISALRRTPKESDIKLYTDSSYLINGITKWVKQWKKIDWMTRAKEDVLNKDLWMELDALVQERTIAWEYVGGHVGIAGNERCHQIATAFADNKKVDLFKGSLAGYAIPNILEIKSAELRIKTKSRRDAPAYSYISSVGGVIEVHHSWPECEERVKGVSGARYKKALNAEDEEKIIEEFGAF
jgi:ribonuclease HI